MTPTCPPIDRPSQPTHCRFHPALCLQEEVTATLQYYQRLVAAAAAGAPGAAAASAATGTSGRPSRGGGGSSHGGVHALGGAAAAACIVPPELSTKPIRDAYFACLEDTVSACKDAAEAMAPAPPAAVAAGVAQQKDAVASRASSPHRRIGAEWLLDAPVPTFVLHGGVEAPLPQRGGATAMTAAAAAAAVGPGGVTAYGSSVEATPQALLLCGPLTEDVRLLLLGANLSHLRRRLVGTLTQRFLLALTGNEAWRCVYAPGCCRCRSSCHCMLLQLLLQRVVVEHRCHGMGSQAACALTLMHSPQIQ